MPEDNGRITLAVLSEKLDTMKLTLESIQRIVNADHDSIISLVTHQSDIDGDLERLKSLEAKVNWWSGINSALAIIAGALGINK